MSLWIRSQDKERLINCKFLGISELNHKFNIIIDDCTLGTYSTKEKALKVLDMIQTFINNELIRDYMVFQMPLDESL